MTIIEGTKIYSPSNSYVWEQAGIEITGDGTPFTIKRYARAHSSGINDPQTSNATGSSPGGDDAFTMNVSDAWKLISTATFNGTPGSSYTFGHSIDKATIYFSPSTSPSVSSSGHSVPYLVPSAPGIPSVSRVSDTQQSLSWSRNATSTAPYSSQQIQRRVYANGAWGSWATIKTGLSGSATSYTDNTTQYDRIYQYRVVAVNSSGSATSGASGNVYTTPASPSSVTATKTETGDILVTVDPNQNSSAVEVVIQHSIDDGSNWSALVTLAAGTSNVTRTHEDPDPADTHRYRAQIVIDSSSAEAGDNLTSGWVESLTVELATPPNPPTGLAPTTPWDATEDRTLSWVHSSPDTAPQSAFQLLHRAVGDTVWNDTGKITSAASAWDLLADTYSNGEAVEWQVQTWAQHEDPSGYSATSTFSFFDRPTIAFSTPEEAVDVPSAALSPAWTFYQEQGQAQAAWKLTLILAGSTLETKPGTGTATTDDLATRLEDGTAYTLRGEVQASSGLWSLPVEVTFPVAYLPPPNAALLAEYVRESGSVTITITPEPTEDGVTDVATTATIYRAIDGADTYVTVLDQVALADVGSTVASDPVPTIAGANQYRVVLFTALGASAIATGWPTALVEDPDSPGMYFVPDSWIEDPDSPGMYLIGDLL